MVSNLSLILDCETTGVDPHHDRIVQLGFILTDWKTVYCAVHSYVDPEIPFDNSHNGLNNQAVVGSPTFLQLLPFTYTLLLYTNEYIAHNWPFDKRFLALELERAGLSLPARPAYDTMRVCGGRTLADSCVLHNIRISDLKLHSAMGDCMATLRLCNKLRPGGPVDNANSQVGVTMGPRL